MKKAVISLMLGTTLLISGCQSAYYSAMEKVGYYKRDIMVNRVEAARESQEEAKAQFSSALAEMQALLNHDGGQLQDAYEKARDEYEAAQSAADDVSNRIDKVEDVAQALFDEWQTEIAEISNAGLRRASQNKLNQTRRNYRQLLSAMQRSESKMQPVLTAMKDNMLYLKHNLNAQAIGAIKGEFNGLQTDISRLIRDMNKSIDESNRFISAMDKH
ncbi:DUF2959 domain-containing protein [Shewanella sp. NFH-SH190041]|uniref:DUF2959 domain-containing protein n=1 Tax=Shewanella sp. NFH-SH190041 TaxID=2950245 RepID=UPI0021C33D36|nr:DUF2959 domain-containing protein [Shewanella sp. NFH-SH190041]BDM65930.1 DUF2959 domain-containing protein [Shewanella sp. NFH-SH190041]